MESQVERLFFETNVRIDECLLDVGDLAKALKESQKKNEALLKTINQRLTKIDEPDAPKVLDLGFSEDDFVRVSRLEWEATKKLLEQLDKSIDNLGRLEMSGPLEIKRALKNLREIQGKN